jgi:hypothetical protein
VRLIAALFEAAQGHDVSRGCGKEQLGFTKLHSRFGLVGSMFLNLTCVGLFFASVVLYGNTQPEGSLTPFCDGQLQTDSAIHVNCAASQLALSSSQLAAGIAINAFAKLQASC